jgi:hypothetical protein
MLHYECYKQILYKYCRSVMIVRRSVNDVRIQTIRRLEVSSVKLDQIKLSLDSNGTNTEQGIQTKGESSTQLTSSLSQLVFLKKSKKLN